MKKTDLVIGEHYLYREDGNPDEPGVEVVLLTKGCDPFLVGVGRILLNGEPDTFSCFASSLSKL